MKKSKMIYGRYNDTVKDGAIAIPWLESKELSLPCFYTVMQCNEKTYVYVHCKAISDEATVIDSGKCFINENKWTVPKSVLDIVGENECVWLGMGDRAELLTEKQIKEAELGQQDLKSLMCKLSELYDL